MKRIIYNGNFMLIVSVDDNSTKYKNQFNIYFMRKMGVLNVYFTLYFSASDISESVVNSLSLFFSS